MSVNFEYSVSVAAWLSPIATGRRSGDLTTMETCSQFDAISKMVYTSPVPNWENFDTCKI